MQGEPQVPIAPLTTLRLGGPARRLVTVTSARDLVAAVADADAQAEPVLVLAGGSNVVIADEGFAGTVVLVRTSGVAMLRDGTGAVRLTVQAGEPWDAVVARCVADGLSGIEALSGIPGSVGGTPIQNVGAYGQEVAETITSVRVYDRVAGSVVVLSNAECGFAYRQSALKGNDRYVVLDVSFALTPERHGRALRYAELASALDEEIGGRALLADVREAVLALRRRKGMVLDPADRDTFSAGSFFTNPILSAAEFAAVAGADGARPPSWPAGAGRVKTSAAWLIERAGFGRGYGHGPVGISTKHTLALTNRGGATTADLLALAREVRDGVRAAFGVELAAEPTLIGTQL
ncbi:MAG: UDP-N-acetylenolpyruvoylglucosamine reductase [Pseudonocardiales bacterium]|nr:MAG: UDP-N-acetylenolpyruvoylglucosamine reductase [Pseudonocardiales bacterium]